MIRAYSNASGVLAQVEWQPGVPLGDDLVWIDLLNPDSAEEIAVEAALGIDIPVREQLAEIEASSRLYVEGRAAFMTATIIVRADRDKPEMDPVTFILTGNRLVTVRYCEPKAFELFVNRGRRDADQCPMSGEAALVGLLEAIVDRLADHLERVGGIVTATSSDVFRHDYGRGRDFYALLARIGSEGDFTSNVRESLVTLARIVAFIPAVTSRRTSPARPRTHAPAVAYQDAAARHRLAHRSCLVPVEQDQFSARCHPRHDHHRAEQHHQGAFGGRRRLRAANADRLHLRHELRRSCRNCTGRGAIPWHWA